MEHLVIQKSGILGFIDYKASNLKISTSVTRNIRMVRKVHYPCLKRYNAPLIPCIVITFGCIYKLPYLADELSRVGCLVAE